MLAPATSPSSAGDLSRPEQSHDARWRLVGRLLLGCILVLRVATFLDYGVTWDEQTERRNGALTLRWYASGMRDSSFLEDRDQYLYGSFFNVLVRPLCRHSPLGYYDTQHLAITLLGFLATVAVYAMATQLAGPMAGVLAVLCLTLTPCFYGHSFNNPKDVPFAALYAIALLLLVRGVGAPLSYKRMLVLGVVIGLTAGVRMIGLALLALAALLVVPIWLRTPASSSSRVRTALRLGFSLAVLSAIAWVVMLVWWPYLQMAPLAHTLDVLYRSGHFSWWSRTVLFNGLAYGPRDLPRAYLPTWLSIALPEFYFVALAGGAGLLLLRLRRLRPTVNAGLRFTIVLLAAVAPLAAALALRPVLYDGIRQLLFVLPPLAVLAGTALAFVVRHARLPWRSLVLALALSSMALTAADMVALHPYEYVYFNRLVAGGLAQAAGRFETDYWGVSYKEAVQWLQRSYRPNARGIRVANCSAEFLTAYELAKPSVLGARFESVDSMDSADVVLATTRWNCHRTRPGRIVHVVERQGVGLCYVIETHPTASGVPALPTTLGSPGLR
jgi:hypothetical protein